MKKINNKGFMLSELLAVTIVILVIFTAIYINFYPTMGEYENRISYNDIDSLYSSYYLRTFLLKYFDANNTVENSILETVNTNKYIVIVENGSCKVDYQYVNEDKTFTCSSIVDKFNISDAIITSYTLDKSISYPTSLNKYIASLPNYKVVDENNNNTAKLYRLIVKTNKGYATEQLYSRVCGSLTYSNWSSWQIKSCSFDSSICESKKLNLKCELTSMKPTNCDSDPLCLKTGDQYRVCKVCNKSETGCGETNVYRTRKAYSNANDVTSFSVSPCEGV